MDKIAVVIILIIVVVAVGFVVWQYIPAPKTHVNPTPLPSGIILFYSPDCPHCQDVEAFIVKNNIDQKVKYTKLEVPFGLRTSTELVANGELAIQLAQKCKMDVSSGVGIPFLYDGNGKCYLGEVDIPNFLKNAAGIQ
jgi:hypothetical protein